MLQPWSDVKRESCALGHDLWRQGLCVLALLTKPNIMLEYDRISSLVKCEASSFPDEIRDARYERRFSAAIHGGFIMDMFGKVGLVEIPVLIAPDQKVWLDRMIKEGKIAIPPGGTLEKGSLYSMFIRMLLHNAMEEQKRQEALDAEDEDEE